MTDSRAVTVLEDGDVESEEYIEALNIAIDALRKRGKRTKHGPLSMDDLMQMNGLPVFLNNYPNETRCFIINTAYQADDKHLPTPCGIDRFGNATSLSLLQECGLYLDPSDIPSRPFLA